MQPVKDKIEYLIVRYLAVWASLAVAKKNGYVLFKLRFCEFDRYNAHVAP
jgi:hypothetical protein